jgi:TonB family protein
MYDYLLRRENIINRKYFAIGLFIATFINFFVLFMFSLMSKVVEPVQLPKEPVIRFVKIEEKPVEVAEKVQPKKSATNKKQVKSVKGEPEAKKIIPKSERKPVKTPQGKTIKREIVKPEKKTVVPPKEKKIVKTDNKKPEKKVSPKKEVKKEKQEGEVRKNQKKTLDVTEKKRPVLPPPEKPDIDLERGNTLEPVKEPNVDDLLRGGIAGIEGIDEKDVNTSKLLQGLQSVKPTNRKLSFGEPLSNFDEGVEGTAISRKIEYMPPPPVIKTRLPAPPRNVKVKIWIAPDGSVKRVQLLKRTGDPMLDKAIVKYFYSWKFNPISSNEVQWAVVNINFKPQ